MIDAVFEGQTVECYGRGISGPKWSLSPFPWSCQAVSTLDLLMCWWKGLVTEANWLFLVVMSQLFLVLDIWNTQG